jgi:predicted peptidase/chitodextrinase
LALKNLGLLSAAVLCASLQFAFGQIENESTAPHIVSFGLGTFNERALRTGTFSNRTTNGVNNYTDPKTWTYWPNTGWSSRFYGGRTNTTGSMTLGSNQLNTSVNFFSGSDVGRTVEVIGAGASGGILVGTINSVPTARQAIVSIVASTTVSNVIIRVGNSSLPAYSEGHYTEHFWGAIKMNYRLLFPRDYNQNENYKYPMIVMLHGAGERGNCWNGNCFYNGRVTSVNGSGSTTINTNVLNCSGCAFTANDVKKVIQIDNAGSSGGTLTTTIATVNSATQVVLATNALATTTGRNVRYGYGSDNQYRNNDLNLVHGGQVHLEAIYNPTTGSNGKKAEDPTLHPRAFPGFVFIPQNQDGWQGQGQFDDATRMIDLLLQAYNIDPDRIYVHGLSNGGAAVWEVVRTRPDLFAAALPMSATISHGAEIFTTETPQTPWGEIEKAVPVPAWIFQGGTDGNPTVGNTNQLVAKLRAAGALPRYTIYPTTGHGTWGAAYNEPDFFRWMLQRNRRDIQVLYGDSTLCATDNSGVTLAVAVGFLAYQWERDGVVIPNSNTSRYNATVAGRYRARYSRLSASPSEAQWNAWSKPVTIRETPAVTPTIVAVGTSHLPDINNGNMVRINGPTTKDLTKNWLVNGTLNTVNSNFNPAVDTANYTLRNTTGRVSLRTIPLSGCPSLESNSIFVTTNTPVTLTAPASPSGVSPAPGVVQLFWTDNTPNETGFEVFRSPTGNPNSYNFYKLLPEGAISFTDTGLTPGATFHYRIRAVNNTAVSAYTNNISVTTQGDSQPPTPPQNLISTNRTLSTATLSWAASTDNVGVASYNIYYGSTTVQTNSTNTTFTVTGLAGNSNYLFTVRAVDAAGNLSPQSNQLAVSTTFSGLTYTYSAVNVDWLTDAGNIWTTPERTGTCADFDIGIRLQDDFFNFNFTGYLYITTGGNYQFRTTSDDGSMMFLGGPFLNPNPDFTTFRIINNDGLQAPTTVTSSPINLPGGQAQQITVIYFEKTGGQELMVEYMGPDTNGLWIEIPANRLNSGNAPPLSPPLAPNNVTATAQGMSSIEVQWQLAAGANSYEIYRAIGNSPNYSIVATVGSGPFVDNNLVPNTIYNYRLKSVSNTNGASVSFSNIATATTAADAQAPTIPQNLITISSSYTNASFQWSASTDNVAVTGYKVYANSTLLGTSNTTTFYTTMLLPATNYAITVSALDATGNESAQSSILNLTTQSPLTFYSKAASNLALLSSWSENSNGTGSAPTDFSFNGQHFVIQQPQTLSSSLTVGGNVSRVIVNDGVTLNISQPLTGTLRVGTGATVNVNVDYQPTFETIATNSTVNFNTYSTVPAASYGNLNLNGSGLKNIPAGNVEVKGNLTIGSGVGLKGAPTNGTTITIAGDIVFGSAVMQPSADNRVAIQFPSGSHNITGITDQMFSKISTTAAGSVVTFNNTSGSPKNLNVGTATGGGLELANGSTVMLGNNNLIVSDQGVINPTNSTGEISINNANVQITTSANTNSNLYFASGGNSVSSFVVQETGSGSIQVRKAVQITDRIKINGGTLAANGNVTLKSTASASAAIQQIVNGSITGNVVVERFMAPKRVYRYISSPVSGVRISDWQNYFPITGTFAGASTGSGLGTNPSLFYYAEPNYIAYPIASNTEFVQAGRGYAAFVRDGVNPTTLVQTGVPNQGNFNFSLTGGTGSPANGWNLLGNPYACDIIWANTGWTFSGVGNVVYVRENLPGGGFTWRIWDRSTNTGNLPNGQIPAGQGFWVQTTTGSPALTVTEAAKSTQSSGTNINYFRSGNDSIHHVLAMSLSNGVNQDFAYVKLAVGASDNFEKLTDGTKNQNSHFNLSTLSTDGVDLAVNELADTFCDKNIPIKLATIANGSYTLNFDNIASFKAVTVQLEDRFAGELININENTSQYVFSVTSDSSSYKNRFVLKLGRPAITLNNVLAVSKNELCQDEKTVSVEVQNSQIGVAYEIVNLANQSVSSQHTGNGSTISINVDVNQLQANENNLRVKAFFQGCTANHLNGTVQIKVNTLPAVSIESNTNGCLGNTLDLIANGDVARYEWINASSGEILQEQSNKLRISVGNSVMGYQVSAISAAGCKSLPRNVLVRADSLDEPIIKMENGRLSTGAANKIQWYFNNSPIVGSNGIDLTPSQSGSYSVALQNMYCTRVSAPYLVTATDDIGLNQMVLTVFPNPSETGWISIKGTGSSPESLEVSINDLVGRKLLAQRVSFENFVEGFELREKLASGVYIVKAVQNNRMVYQKVVVR